MLPRLTKNKLLSKSLSAMKQLKPNHANSGFTLIEVLVVISILAVLTALLIPQLRMVNKERVSRESARVVASFFTQASQRAVIDGSSGVLLERNPNFADGLGYSYAVTGMSLLRAVPNFAGDQIIDSVVGVGGGAGDDIVAIPLPLEQAELEIVKAGDRISFNGSSVEYTIEAVMPDGGGLLQLDLDLAGQKSYLPAPNAADGILARAAAQTPPVTIPFVIRRLPRPLKSSFTELPRDHLIDLRFSGFTMLDSGYNRLLTPVDPTTTPVTSRLRTSVPMQFVRNVLEPHPRGPSANGLNLVDFGLSDVAILFGPDGEVDRMVLLAQDGLDNTVVFQRPLIDNLRLFVAEAELDDPNGTIAALNPINSASNLWVSVSKNSGAANVGYNVAPATQLSIFDLDTKFNSTDPVERAEFNTVIDLSRGDSDVSTAAQ